MANLATQFISRTYQQPYRPVESEKIAGNGKAPLLYSTDSYNEFIWALARKFTNSADEAEAAVKEMQSDIERCAKERTGLPSKEDKIEDKIIAQIAWRRLLKFLQ
jgi:hypothetical protein